ncbi:MAG: alanine:cation symporter family protein, partial [Lachnospiraceae bacterium]|nr:alanine:cation symporter family protein [Lachnospiraceae bacterium]
RALKKRWMGILFSVLLIICFAYGFNALQSYNMSSALQYYVEDYSNTVWPLVLGIVLAIATAFVIWGGVHRIGFISSFVVPFMAIAYILMSVVIMIMNINELPRVFSVIFKGAFDFKAMAGGFAGSAIVIGVKRGLFSNEAGMGSAPNASASADVVHPVKQGLVQVISVFIDTILICSSTAMMLLVSGVEGKSGTLDGIPYVQKAISSAVGEWGIHFITFSIFAFAFSSLIGNYFYAESNILFIKDNKILLNMFRVTCVIAIFLGAQADFSLVWNIADITMGFMAIVNIIAIFMLRKVVFKTLSNYEGLKKSGKPIEFVGEDIGIEDTVWERKE